MGGVWFGLFGVSLRGTAFLFGSSSTLFLSEPELPSATNSNNVNAVLVAKKAILIYNYLASIGSEYL